MSLSRSTLSLLTVLAIFAALGVGIGWRLLGNEEETRTTRPELPDTEGVEVESVGFFGRLEPVEGAEVTRDTLWIQMRATGHAEASRRSRIATRAAGVVERVLVSEGDLVERGQLLLQLDTVEAAMNLAQARASVVAAQAVYEVRMAEGDDPTRSDEDRERRELMVRHRSGLVQAEMNLERARREMEWTEVRAPFAGRVADLDAVEGAFLGAGGEVLTLLQLDPIRIEVRAGEADVAYLRPGRRASVFLAGLPDRRFTARVAAVNPTVDSDDWSARVTLEMPNPDHSVYPGMFARVSVDARWYEDRVMVPREALTQRDRRDVVFIARNLNEDGEGITEWRYVTTGFRNETHVEIVPHEDTSMLEAGEIVLVDGHHTIAHDIPIRLVDNVRAAGGRPGARR